MRRRLAWLVAVPLALAGSQAAHALAYAARLSRHAVRGACARRRPGTRTSTGCRSCSASRSRSRSSRSLAAGRRRRAAAGRARDVPAWAFALLAPAASSSRRCSSSRCTRARSAGTRSPPRRSCRALRSSCRSRSLACARARGCCSARRVVPAARSRTGRRAAAPLPSRRAVPAGTSRRARLASPGFRRVPHARRLRRRDLTDRISTKEETMRASHRARRARRAGAALATSASAFAHAHVSPPVVLANEGQVFTLAVPTEKEGATTTTIELTPPEGLLDRLVRRAPGWKRTVQQTGSGEEAAITKVTWTRRLRADGRGRRVLVPREHVRVRATTRSASARRTPTARSSTGRGPSRPTRRRRSSRRGRRSAAAALAARDRRASSLGALALAVAVGGLALLVRSGRPVA